MNPNVRLLVACMAGVLIVWSAFARLAPSQREVPDGGASPLACDDASFLRLVPTHPRGYTEVTVCGTVTRVLPERTTRSGTHAYFYVAVPGAPSDVEIVTNVDETGAFAVKPGDTANVRGRYYDDADGTQGIDWTHRSDARASWPYAGYVQIDGGPLVR